MDEVLKTIEDLDLSTATVYGVQEIRDGEAAAEDFEYVPRAQYSFEVTQGGQPVFANMDPSIKAPKEMNICMPEGLLMDNLYFPTILWDGRYQTSKLTDSAFVAWLLKTAERWSLPNYGLATILAWMDAYGQAKAQEDPEPLSVVFWMKSVDLVKCLSHQWCFNFKAWFSPYGALAVLPGKQTGSYNSRIYLMPYPDVGYLTMPYAGWASLAPIGRSYMTGWEKGVSVFDYVLSLAGARYDSEYFSAQALHGPAVPAEKKDDGALVLAVDVEWRPTVAINSDLFPGGNYTHFFRRDIQGVLIHDAKQCAP